MASKYGAEKNNITDRIKDRIAVEIIPVIYILPIISFFPAPNERLKITKVPLVIIYVR